MTTVIEWTGDTQGQSSPVHEVTGASRFAVQRDITGAPSAAVVSLEGSLNGSARTALVSTTHSTAVFWNTNWQPVRYLRIRITSLTGGTDPTVSAVALAI